MNYAVKTLLNQAKLCNDLIAKKRANFQIKDFETSSEYEFCVTDITNLQTQIDELVKAIEILTKIN